MRAFRVLPGEFLRLTVDISGGFVGAVTPAARQAVGQWPSGENLVQQLIDGLTVAAEREADPDRKNGLRQAAGLLGGAVRDVAVGVAQAYADRRLGLGPRVRRLVLRRKGARSEE